MSSRSAPLQRSLLLAFTLHSPPHQFPSALSPRPNAADRRRLSVPLSVSPPTPVEGDGSDLVALEAPPAAAPGGGGSVLDPSDDCDGGGCVDGQWGAAVADGVREGAGQLFLPVQPLRALHHLPVLREGRIHVILAVSIASRGHQVAKKYMIH